jgi:hypothetical protein
MARAGEDRGVEDLEATLSRAPGITTADLAPPHGIRVVPWVEHHLARPAPGAACALVPNGFPTSWFGASVEAYHLPAGPRHVVSYAIRWHGERPAVLWEVAGPAGLRLTGGAADPAWHTDLPTGEALWASPPGAAEAIAAAALGSLQDEAQVQDTPTDLPGATIVPEDVDPSDGISFS